MRNLGGPPSHAICISADSTELNPLLSVLIITRRQGRKGVLREHLCASVGGLYPFAARRVRPFLWRLANERATNGTAATPFSLLRSILPSLLSSHCFSCLARLMQRSNYIWSYSELSALLLRDGCQAVPPESCLFDF